MRLIDADLIQYEPMLSAKGNGMYEDVMVTYKSQIDDLPTIEERKTGHWINAYPNIEPDPMFMYGICSICGYEQSISNKLKFCPDCGARMKI